MQKDKWKLSNKQIKSKHFANKRFDGGFAKNGTASHVANGFFPSAVASIKIEVTGFYARLWKKERNFTQLTPFWRWNIAIDHCPIDIFWHICDITYIIQSNAATMRLKKQMNTLLQFTRQKRLFFLYRMHRTMKSANIRG